MKRFKKFVKNLPLKKMAFWGACAGLLVFLSAMTGCALTDAVTGVNSDANDGGFLGGLGKAISGLPGWLGLVGTLIGGGAAGYQAKRKKELGKENANYDEMINALVAGIDKATNGGLKEEVSKEDLYKALELAKVEFMTDPVLLTAIIAEIKSRLRAK